MEYLVFLEELMAEFSLKLEVKHFHESNEEIAACRRKETVKT